VKICAVIDPGYQGRAEVWVDLGHKRFARIAFRKGQEPEMLEETLPGEFRSYKHFVGVQGGHCPWVFFLAKPVPLRALTFESVQAAIQAHDLKSGVVA
jgi:hypothetical protein